MFNVNNTTSSRFSMALQTAASGLPQITKTVQ